MLPLDLNFNMHELKTPDLTGVFLWELLKFILLVQRTSPYFQVRHLHPMINSTSLNPECFINKYNPYFRIFFLGFLEFSKPLNKWDWNRNTPFTTYYPRKCKLESTFVSGLKSKSRYDNCQTDI